MNNDGDALDTYAVSGCTSSSNFGVSYFNGSRDITDRVMNGAYRVTDVAPGTTRQLRAVIRVTSDAPNGAAKVCAVVFSSRKEPSLSDSVRAVVEARG